MKIIDLEIRNIRGIKDITLHPNGENFVIWGPNGSGKSAVVDSLDFLLTGKINRLTGPGTQGITLKKHGPHIDSKAKDAFVKAIIKFPEIEKPVEIYRCIKNPDDLLYDDEFKNYIEPYLELAKRGQHVLTRKEILRYINSEAGKRAEHIQELLNLGNVELVRKNLVTIKNNFNKNISELERVISDRQKSLCTIVNIEKYDEQKILEYINKKRKILSVSEITVLSTDQILRNLDLTKEEIKEKVEFNITYFKEKIDSLFDKFKIKEQIMQKIIEISDELIKIKKDDLLLQSLIKIGFIRDGIKYLDGTGSCPLCDTLWEKGKLKKHLTSKLSELKEYKTYYDEFNIKKEYVLEYLNILNENYIYLIDNSDILCNELKNQLININENVKSVIGEFEKKENEIDENLLLYLNDKIFIDIKSLNKINEIYLDIEKNKKDEHILIDSWEILIRIEENLKGLNLAIINYKKAEIPQKLSQILHDEFLKSRDEVLSHLYNSIRDMFVNLYREIHGSDETNFTAKIEPRKAGIDFEVDFYKRGEFPPNALHSEGHQDSMGLCLYFSLSNALTEGFIDLIILDDVVMSVDSDHRRQICTIFKKFFPHRQFLITTHDKTWANQLKSTGVVTSKNLYEFFNWNIETGPTCALQEDIWDKIETDLKNEDVSSAAAKLRRSSEAFFASVCDALQAQIPYNLTHRWDLGQYLPSAMAQYSELLKKAKNAANSWNQKDAITKFDELESIKKQIFDKSQVENWAINPNIHFTNWANFSPNDFRPVVDTYQDLWALFICPQCNTLIKLTTIGSTPKSIECNCGTYNWNLIEKK